MGSPKRSFEPNGMIFPVRKHNVMGLCFFIQFNGNNILMKKHILLLLLLTCSSDTFARVYKCTVNGKFVYSQTSCGEEAKEIQIYDKDKFHQDSITNWEQSKAEALQGKGIENHANKVLANQIAMQNQKNALYEEYQNRRASFVDELNNLNLGSDQSIGSLIANKSRKTDLEFTIRQLDMDYANSIDPQGAQERMLSNQVEELNGKVDKLNKKIKASANATCQVSGNFTYCSDGTSYQRNGNSIYKNR